MRAQVARCVADEFVLSERVDVKVQRNGGGGGAFPLHWDTSPSVSKRIFTAIVYLNPSWSRGDGGELLLAPFPYAPVRVAPLLDRLVIFSSTSLLHRVLPSSAERFCVTVWLEGQPLVPAIPSWYWLTESQGQGQGDEEASSSSASLLRPLLHGDSAKAFAKLVWAEEWDDSIRQRSFHFHLVYLLESQSPPSPLPPPSPRRLILLSFKGVPELPSLLAASAREREAIECQIPPSLVAFVRENLPLLHDHAFRRHLGDALYQELLNLEEQGEGREEAL